MCPCIHLGSGQSINTGNVPSQTFLVDLLDSFRKAESDCPEFLGYSPELRIPLVFKNLLASRICVGVMGSQFPVCPVAPFVV